MNPQQSKRSSRRKFLSTTASLAAAGFVATTGESRAELPEPGKFPVVSISSGNGRPTTRKAYEMILAGSDTADAVVAGVNIVENDPKDMSVGFGGLPNERGVVELDAAVMHGPSSLAGSVGSIQNIKNPASVAKLVMRTTDHIMLVGAGALEFAKANGFPEENLLTEQARAVWLQWKRNLSDKDDWLSVPEEKMASILPPGWKRPTGTIHCSALNTQGDLSCTTTTSGLAFKIPGRVGDSPIIAAGLYVDNEVGSCGATGRGEEVIRNAGSFAGVELMRTGMSPKEAGLEVLRRIVKHAKPSLIGPKGKPLFDVQMYLLRKDGLHAGVSIYPTNYSVTDNAGTRHEPCAALYKR